MVLVDSSAWIEALRHKGSLEAKVALDGLLEVYEARLCAPVRLEVLGGARAAERSRLGAYFSLLPYRSCGPDDWDRAIALAWKLRDNGITVPWMDVRIAAIALKDEERVYAIDHHFAAIARVTGLRLYEPGPGGLFQPPG
jgi:predicted nucleic acid-binding protein